MLGSEKKKILIVDDEQSICDSLSLLLAENFDVEALSNGEDFLKNLKNLSPDLVFLDLHLPGLDGIEILKTLKKEQNKIPIVMLSGSNTVQTAVQAIKLGAVDYVKKPFNIDELTSLIFETLYEESPVLKDPPQSIKSNIENGEIIASCKEMMLVLEKIKQVAPHPATILITGESGTGKELVARSIHKQSGRSNKSFIALNCAALPENLIEAELFGYERGAFTGADKRKVGLIEQADEGTLFLDEIGEMPLSLQVKLLRFIQEKEFYRLGGSRSISVDTRILTATNQKLEEQIKSGEFREDLFYRINVVNIILPPLRERSGELGLLIQHFSKKFSKQYKKQLTISPDAMAVLEQYDWPGNVRELENTLESLFALVLEGVAEEKDLPPRIRVKKDKKLQQQLEVIIDEQFDFQEAGQEFERSMIIQALRRTNNVQTKAAKLLGITRRMLKYKMDKLGIE